MRDKTLFGKINIPHENTELKYYILEQELNPETNKNEWGIEIEATNDKGEFNSSSVRYFSPGYDETVSTIKTLIKNKVTPLTLYEVLEEILI